jgi:hypothetical protein
VFVMEGGALGGVGHHGLLTQIGAARFASNLPPLYET